MLVGTLNTPIRIALYVLLTTAMVVCGILFYRNYTAESHREVKAPTQEPAESGQPEELKSAAIQHDYHRMLICAGAFLASAVALGLLAAHDLSGYFGGSAVEFLFNEESKGQKNPQYERAEQEWADGRHLEAIRLMREYLTRYPREQYVALRIAEIYEKDLHNPLAAAMEYEEVLKKKLPPERWGWAAIHLANLYSGKLNRTDDAMALLNRIVNEFGQTAAAKKARERLGLPEEAPVAPPVATPVAPLAANPAPAPLHLPAGFRPKTAAERADHHGPVSERVSPLKAEESKPAEPPPAPALPPGFRPKKG